MAKNVIIGILSLLVVALIADCVWLHINCQRQQEDIAALAQDQSKTLKAVKNLENWVATSSVESKIKNYKQELEGYKQSFMDKCRSLKDAAMKSYEAARDELTK